MVSVSHLAELQHSAAFRLPHSLAGDFLFPVFRTQIWPNYNIFPPLAARLGDPYFISWTRSFFFFFFFLPPSFSTSTPELHAGRSATTHPLVSRSKPGQQRGALAVLQWLFQRRSVTMHFFHAIKQMLYYRRTMPGPSETVYHVKGSPGSGCLPPRGAF